MMHNAINNANSIKLVVAMLPPQPPLHPKIISDTLSNGFTLLILVLALVKKVLTLVADVASVILLIPSFNAS